MDDIDQARLLLEEGNRAGAVQLLEKVLAEDIDQIEAWRLMAHAVTDLQDITECYEHVLRLNPRDEEAISNLRTFSLQSNQKDPLPFFDEDFVTLNDEWQQAAGPEVHVGVDTAPLDISKVQDFSGFEEPKTSENFFDLFRQEVDEDAPIFAGGLPFTDNVIPPTEEEQRELETSALPFLEQTEEEAERKVEVFEEAAPAVQEQISPFTTEEPAQPVEEEEQPSYYGSSSIFENRVSEYRGTTPIYDPNDPSQADPAPYHESQEFSYENYMKGKQPEKRSLLDSDFLFYPLVLVFFVALLAVLSYLLRDYLPPWLLDILPW